MRPLAFIVVVFVSAIGISSATAEGPVLSVSHLTPLPGKACRWTADDVSGDVYASLFEDGKAICLKRDGDVRWMADVGPAPVSILKSGDRVLVACTENEEVWILDSSTGGEIGRVSVASEARDQAFGPVGICADPNDANRLYAWCSVSEQREDQSRWYRIDLAKQTIVDKAAFPMAVTDRMEAVIDPTTGLMLVARGNGGHDSLRVYELKDSSLIPTLKYAGSGSQDLHVLPGGRGWGVDKRAVSVDLQTIKTTYREVAHHPTQSMTADVSSASISVHNQAGGIGGRSILIPELLERSKQRSRRSPKPGSYDTIVKDKLWFDGKGQSLFVGQHESAAWIDLKAAMPGTDDLPPLKLPMWKGGPAGRPMEVSISIAETFDASGTALRLKEPVEGVSIENKTLKWSGSTMLTSATVELVKTASDEVLDSARIVLETRSTTVPLGYAVIGLQLSPDEKRLLVYGRTNKPGTHVSRRQRANAITIIDAGTGGLVASRTWDEDLEAITIGNDHVFVSIVEEPGIQRYDHLLKKSRRYVTPTPLREIHVTGSNQVIALGQTQPMRFQIDPLEPLSLYPNEPKPEPDAKPERYVVQPRGPNKALVNNVMVDIQTDKTLRFTPDHSLPVLRPWSMKRVDFHGSNYIAKQYGWGRVVVADRYKVDVMTSGGGRLFDTRGYASLSRKLPILFVATGETLTILDVMFGDSIKSSPLATAPRTRSNESRDRPSRRQQCVNTDAAFMAVVRDELIWTPLETSTFESIETPVHFLDKQSVWVPYSANQKVAINVSGGDPTDLTFTLGQPTTTAKDRSWPNFSPDPKLVSINEKTGELSIDPIGLWKRYCKTVEANYAKWKFRAGNRPFPYEPTENARMYARWTGKPIHPKGYATQLPLEITVTDSSGNSDVMAISFLMVGPRAMVSKAISKSKM